jgi:SAM-dependent methyltransferase
LTYRLPPPEKTQLGDAENLPFESNYFDLGYSFGVLHHTPDTEKAVTELVRVVRPGGEIKLMLYNRCSIYVFNLWIKNALLRGHPWKSLRWILCNHMESVGTKGYTRKELSQILSVLPLHDIEIRTEFTAADYLSASVLPPLNWFYKFCLRAAGYHYGWHPSHYVGRVNDPIPNSGRTSSPRDSQRILFTGNRLGFFHCIHAWKNV